MTNWITITVEDLNGYLTAAQKSAVLARNLGPLQTDPIPGTIAGVVALIRSQIRSHRANRLDGESVSSIPPELKCHACHLALESLQTRISGLKLTDSQAAFAKFAHQQLDAIGRGELVISPPKKSEDVSVLQTTIGIEIADRRVRHISGKNLSGF